MNAKEHVEALCKDLEIDSALQKTERESFLLPLNAELEIEIKPLAPSGVFFYAPLSPCPPLKKEELFITLMKANLFGQGTLDALIGLSKNETFLTLSMTCAFDMNYKTFKDRFEDFANIVDYWKEEIRRHNTQAENNLL